ncbi:MAG: prepilin-type N-terminal cleavage/methylation domain-containing protein [Lentisphaeria bacterium]|nr:prepilin-type N-terminal cleavage/methylation domain-containing protein [Lentisphaeria bacterium]
MKSKIKTFTLIELLVVIAIIAILSRSKNSFFLLFSAI